MKSLIFLSETNDHHLFLLCANEFWPIRFIKFKLFYIPFISKFSILPFPQLQEDGT